MQTKDGNIHEDEEIFYEAEENIRTSSLKQNNTHKESLGKENKIFSKSNNPNGNYNLLVSKNVLNKIENEDEEKIVSPLKKRDTIYEDAEDHITEKLPDLEEFGIIPSENNMISISDSKIKSELNPFDKYSCNDFEKSSFDELKKGKGKSRKEKQRERKLEILNQDLKDIKIDIEFLKKNLRQIPTKLKGIKEKHLQMLFELQSFQGDSQQIWTTKISFDGRYIATGGKSGVLKIFEILTEEESLDNYEFLGLLSYFKLINEHAYRIYTEHTQDIIDICWSSIKQNCLLSASLDHNVILWDVNFEYPVKKFYHNAMVSTVSFSTNFDEFTFVSGCFDKIVRIWNPEQNKVIDYINVQEYVTSIAYFPTGEKIAVGSHTGKCSIYEVKPRLKYSYSFDCKNKSGKFSDGRKITNIEFLNMNLVLITTNDSSVRLVNVNDGKVIQKYKGLKNEEYMIRASFEEIYDLVISGSDDGYTYIWNKINPIHPNDIKNKVYEYFKPFESTTENATCSIFTNDIAYSSYIKKFLLITQDFYIKSVIINTSSTGKIQILINIEK